MTRLSQRMCRILLRLLQRRRVRAPVSSSGWLQLRGSWEATLSKGMKRFDQSQSECDLTKSAAYHQFKS